MASLNDTLQALFDPLAPGGAWLAFNANEPLELDENGKVLAYIVWQDIVSTDNVSFDGASNLQNSRIQVDIFAPRRTDVDAIKKSVDAALVPLKAVPLSTQPIYESLVKLWRITRDYSIWFDESQS